MYYFQPFPYIYIYNHINTSSFLVNVLRGTFTFPYFTLDSGICGVVLSFNPSTPKLSNLSHPRVYFGKLRDSLNSSGLTATYIYIYIEIDIDIDIDIQISLYTHTYIYI